MRSAIKKLATSGQSFGTVLVAGPGQGPSLLQLRALDARRLVFADPVPASAEAMERSLDAGRGEQVWPVALLPQPAAESTVHLVSQPQHSSVREPGALLSLFRGLQRSGTATVPGLAIAEAIERLALPDDQ